MNNSIAKTFLLAVLLLLLVSPFAALAPLVGIVTISVIAMMVWPLVRILLFGTQESDRATASESFNPRSDEPPVPE